MQLEIGTSTIRYFPASGTAGLARSLVSGNRRFPCPPPMMTQSTLLVLSVWRPNCDIRKLLVATTSYNPFAETGQATSRRRRDWTPGEDSCACHARAVKSYYAFTEPSCRHHRRQRTLQHRRLHQSEMGENQDSVRPAVG